MVSTPIPVYEDMLAGKNSKPLCDAAARRGAWAKRLEEDCRARPIIRFPHLAILLASCFSDSQARIEITGKFNERKADNMMDKRESERRISTVSITCPDSTGATVAM